MKISKFIAVTIVCALIAITCCGCGHIKDTNGDDDFSLVTLSEQQIIKGNSSVSSVSASNQWNNKYNLKVSKFSGVKELKKITLKSGTQKITTDVNVSAGNFRMVLISGGQIVYDFDINGTSSATISEGTYIIKIAGESASFNLSFSIE
ncbi:MAG: hypothetical protein J1F36_01920 [Clostridiales bacterium]|nr:hypothetical protein [Clostridiales bacterium]